MPGHVLGAVAQAYEPGTRAASAPGRQPPVRRRGRGASPGAGRGYRPPNPAAQRPSWTPRTTPSPTQLLTGPRGRAVANIAAPGGPSDRAAGRPPAHTPIWVNGPCYLLFGEMGSELRVVSDLCLTASQALSLPDGPKTWGSRRCEWQMANGKCQLPTHRHRRGCQWVLVLRVGQCWCWCLSRH
jgi:hypothetical protein